MNDESENSKKIIQNLVSLTDKNYNEPSIRSGFLLDILEHIPAAIAVVTGPDHIYEFTNRYHDKYTGKSNLEGQMGRQVFPELDQQGIWNLLDEVYFNGSPFYGEEYPAFVQFQGSNNMTEAYFNFGLIPLKEQDDKVYGVLIFAYDVTSLVYTKKLVVKGELRQRQILESIPQMAWTATPEGVVNYYNQRWYEYTGLSPEEDISQGWKNVLHPEDVPLIGHAWSKCVSELKTFEKQIRFRNVLTREYRWFLVRAVPFSDESGKTIFWVGTCTDIHDQIKTQEELFKTNQGLYELNDKLIQANTDLDNFVYSASHNLRGPVASLDGLLNMIELNMYKEEELKDLIQMMRTTLTRFKDTVDSLADISKVQRLIETKDIFLNNIKNVVEEIMEEIGFYPYNLEFKTNALPSIQFSKDNFKRILFNLLSNSVKFRSANRTLTIFVKSYYWDNHPVVEVSDNGIGIAKGQQKIIFNMFKKGHQYTIGVGVGLYIVKRIMENSGGNVELESEESRGTIVRLIFKV